MTTSIEIKRRFKGFDYELPTGGQVFEPTGLIGPWFSGMFYRVWSEDEDAAKEADPSVMTMPTRSGVNYACYFSNRSIADKFAKQHGKGFPNCVLRMTVEKNRILNLNDPSIFEGDVLARDLDVTTLMARNNRHHFHLIFLPSSVHAVATAYGYDVPELDFSALEDPDTVYNDRFRFEYIGNPDVAPDDPDGWMNSHLGKQRAELWAALKEPDVTKFALSGMERYRTYSDDLIACLEPAALWDGAWLRVVDLPDPGFDASYTDSTGNLKRRRTPSVYTRYYDEAEAQKAADEMAVRFKKDNGDSNDEPALPSAWRGQGMKERWIEELTRLVTGDAPMQVICNDLECSAVHVNEWKKRLGL